MNPTDFEAKLALIEAAIPGMAEAIPVAISLSGHEPSQVHAILREGETVYVLFEDCGTWAMLIPEDDATSIEATYPKACAGEGPTRH